MVTHCRRRGKAAVAAAFRAWQRRTEAAAELARVGSAIQRRHRQQLLWTVFQEWRETAAVEVFEREEQEVRACILCDLEVRNRLA